MINNFTFQPPVKRLPVAAALVASLACATPSFASDVSNVELYGYAKLDLIYDLNQDLGGTVDATAIDTSGATDEANFRAHARQTRLGVKADIGGASVKIEGDFFGSGGNEVVSNSYGLRLRHAYGQWGNWLAGQTWTTFMDFAAYPSTVDFDGPAGPALARQAQLRYTTGNLSFAIENPEPTLGAPEGVTAAEKLPDLVAKYSVSGDAGAFFASGVLQTAEVSGGAADGDSASQLGIYVGGNLKLGSGTLMLSGIANAGRYGYYGFSNPAFIVVGSELETIDYTGITAGYSVGGFNLAVGNVSFDDEFLSVGDIENIRTIHANYMFSPRKNVNYMIEVSNAEREDVGGASESNTRLQFAMQYNF